MRKSTVCKIFDIVDNPKLTREEKINKVLAIFLKQKKIDWPLLKGILLEDLQAYDLVEKLDEAIKNKNKIITRRV